MIAILLTSPMHSRIRPIAGSIVEGATKDVRTGKPPRKLGKAAMGVALETPSNGPHKGALRHSPASGKPPPRVQRCRFHKGYRQFLRRTTLKEQIATALPIRITTRCGGRQIPRKDYARTTRKKIAQPLPALLKATSQGTP